MFLNFTVVIYFVSDFTVIIPSRVVNSFITSKSYSVLCIRFMYWEVKFLHWSRWSLA